MAVECLVRKYDGPGGRMAGDIVSVKSSPARWGKCEGLPNYVIVIINDISLKDFEAYKGRHIVTGTVDVKGKPEKVRSKYRFNLKTLSNYQEVNPFAMVSKVQMEANVIDRKAEFLASR